MDMKTLKATLILCMLALGCISFSTLCQAEPAVIKEPLWEIGVVGAGAYLPHYRGSDEYTWSQGKNEKVWWATCDNCNHFTVYSYCADSSCRNRLIKNGAYWTYHSTEPLNPGNIKCPSCAGIL